jgi:MoaA/NifB/PqqE/SkfB family radical SAM enzyme
MNWLSAAKLYRTATKAYALLPYCFSRSGRTEPVWHYFFEVTRRCNLRCQMCQYEHWLKTTPVSVQKEGELTTDEWRRVIDQVQRWGMITFTGGEPYVREDFPDLLEYASARTRTHVITNAVLLDDEQVRRCVAIAPKKLGGRGLNFAGTSIEGPAEIHDAIRMREGAFERSTGAVRRLAELRNSAGKQCPMIHVTSVIQAGNVDHLAEMPRIVMEAGGDVLNFTLEVRNWDLDGLGKAAPSTFDSVAMKFPRIDPDRLTNALRATRAAAGKLGLEVRFPDMPDAEIVRYYSGETDLLDFRCLGVWTNLFVGAKGDIFLCWLLSVGNVREKTLREVWNGPQFRAFRRRARQRLYGPCLGCCFLTHQVRK